MRDSSPRSLTATGLLLRLVLLGLPTLFACGARSGLDCFGERCGVGGEAQEPDGAIDDDDDDDDRPDDDDPVGGVPVPPRPDVGPPPDVAPPDVPAEEPSRGCGPDGRYNGSFVALSDPQQLADLVGCREVDGDLAISGMVIDDLSELSELRSVTGTLELSSLTGTLQGLENLQSVNNLLLVDLNVPNFTPFVSLLQIGVNPLDGNSGQLGFAELDGPFDLSGFGSLISVRSLTVSQCGTLQSLSGLSLPSALTSVSLSSCLGLVDLSPLAALGQLDTLHFSDLGVTSLGGLLNLVTARSIALINLPDLADSSGLSSLSNVDVLYIDNTALTSLSGLSTVLSMENVVISNNPILTDLEGLGQLQELVELSVTDNASLSALPVLSNIGVMEQLSVRRNPLLLTGPRFPNLVELDQLDISENASLTDVLGLPSLQTARSIEVRSNSALTSVDLGGLSNVRSLHISCNPVLPESSVTPLASVSGTSVIQGNEGSASPCVEEDPL